MTVERLLSHLLEVDLRIPGVWAKVRPYAESAIEKTCFSDLAVDDLLPLCLSGQAKAWIIVNGEDVIGAGVTTIKRYPRRSHLEIAFFGAEEGSEIWDQHFGDMVEHARANSCDTISMSGRVGWARKLKSMGVPVRTKQVVEVDLGEMP